MVTYLEGIRTNGSLCTILIGQEIAFNPQTKARVYEAKDVDTDQDVVVKFSSTNPLSYQRELGALTKINLLGGHPSLVDMYAQSPQGDKWVAIPRYGKDMGVVIRGGEDLTSDKLVVLAHDLYSALSYMHINGIIHHDIKAENVLNHSDSHKVIDLGHCTYEGIDPHPKDVVFGSPPYITPEMAVRNPKLIEHLNLPADTQKLITMDWFKPDTPSDVYQAAITMFYAINRFFPIPPKTTPWHTVANKLVESPRTLRTNLLPESTVKLLGQSMDMNPKHRPLTQEILDSLKESK